MGAMADEATIKRLIWIARKSASLIAAARALPFHDADFPWLHVPLPWITQLEEDLIAAEIAALIGEEDGERVNVELLPHWLDRIAGEIAHHRRERNNAQSERDFRRMAEHERFLEGAELVLGYLGPRQRQALDDKIADAANR